ncbi:MAG: glycosyltransferase [Victivallales bacterium]|nr:glycosyltransferase [Victivallales bacterium]
MPKFPLITVVTPSFNQKAYLERTICSVLEQDYPNIEYIIIDGGSTDGSIDVIERYQNRIAFWVSEPDRGQTHAINKGLQMATGEWVAWQNSDDIYYPGVFHQLSEVALKYPKAGLLTGDMMLIDEHDRPLRDIRYVIPSYRALLAEGMLIANQAAFWRRSVHDKIGFLTESFQCSFDYEWFLRLTKQVKAKHVNRIWGGLRLHGETKTSLLTQRFQEENQIILSERNISTWLKNLYRLRRFSLMLVNGQFSYVYRGLLRRASRQERTTY